MTKDEALKLALECLDGVWRGDYSGNAKEVITAIKEALANEALEKMAENARELGLDYEPEQDWIERERAVGYREGHQNALKQMAQPEQEPVVCDCDSPSWCKQYKKCNRKMLGFMPYVAQPQRTWVGLTDKDWNRSKHNYDFQKGVDWAESILKEKNT